MSDSYSYKWDSTWAAVWVCALQRAWKSWPSRSSKRFSEKGRKRERKRYRTRSLTGGNLCCLTEGSGATPFKLWSLMAADTSKAMNSLTDLRNFTATAKSLRVRKCRAPIRLCHFSRPDLLLGCVTLSFLLFNTLICWPEWMWKHKIKHNTLKINQKQQQAQICSLKRQWDLAQREHEKSLPLILRAGNSAYLRGRITSWSSYVSEEGVMQREMITAKAWSQPPTLQHLERHSVGLSLLRPGVKHKWGEDKFGLPGAGWPVELSVHQIAHILKPNAPYRACKDHTQLTPWLTSFKVQLMLCALAASKPWLRCRAICLFGLGRTLPQFQPSPEVSAYLWKDVW